MKKICAITMARNDAFFLEHWIAYYGAILGEENLYIYLDGMDQPIPPNSGKANITHCERVIGQVAASDRGRINRISDMASTLLKHYDLVIGTDADEFLILDPDTKETLPSYLSKLDIKCSVSGLGLDVGQKLGDETTIDGNLPFLSQRSYAVISSRYTKPVVLAKPVRWGAGFHRVKGHNFKIDHNLYLLHFGMFDMEMLKARFQDKDRMEAGWERHLKKRSKIIRLVTARKAKDGDRYFGLARMIQTFCRPIFALNKPSMGRWKPVIKLPERFKKIII